MQQASEFLAVGPPPPHRRLEQRLLDLAGHVAPDIQRRPSQQTGQAVQSIRHIDLPRSLRMEQPLGNGVPELALGVASYLIDPTTTMIMLIVAAIGML
jgi:hypothetical protein